MMKNDGLFGIFAKAAMFVTLYVASSAGPAVADGLGNTEQFALEMRMTSNSGESAGQSMDVKYYVGEDRIRMEASVAGMGGGGGSITVFEGEDVIMYVLIPQMKQYMRNVGTADDYMDEGPGLIFGLPEEAGHPCQSDPDKSCEKLGSDTLLGRPVDKYRVTEIEDGVTTESIFWFDRELLLPLKVEDDEGVMEATSLEIGAQRNELFEVPSDYTEMKMPY